MSKVYTKKIQSLKGRPLFSIIIPAFQCETTIAESIESVLQQNEESFEIILVDDGSTDRSGEICDYYSNLYPSRVKVIHKTNEGPLIARIEGVEASNGTYIMFLDADDAYSNGMLSYIKKAIYELNGDMVIFNYFRVFSDGSRHVSPALYPNKTIFEGKNLKQLYQDAVSGPNLNAVWQKCIDRTILQDVDMFRKYGNMVMGEDKILSLKMLDRAKRVIYLSDGLYQYNIREDGLSHAFSLKHYQDLSVVYKVALQYGKKWNIDNCETQYNKDKVILGIKCLYSVTQQICNKKKIKQNFILLARVIINDLDFWQAYNKCKKNEFGMNYSIICWLLQHNRVDILFSLLYINAFFRRRVF